MVILEKGIRQTNKEPEMTELLSTPLLKELGTTALMFICFYLILKITEKNLEALINQQKDFILHTFEMLKEMIQVNLLNSSLLQEIKDKINTNQWCPYARKLMNNNKENKPNE